MKLYIKEYKEQVIEIALKGKKYYSIELLEKGFDRLSNRKYYFDTKKGKLFGKLFDNDKVSLIEEYCNQEEYNIQDAFDIALDTFARNTRNQASMISRGY